MGGKGGDQGAERGAKDSQRGCNGEISTRRVVARERSQKAGQEGQRAGRAKEVRRGPMNNGSTERLQLHA